MGILRSLLLFGQAEFLDPAFVFLKPLVDESSIFSARHRRGIEAKAPDLCHDIGMFCRLQESLFKNTVHLLRSSGRRSKPRPAVDRGIEPLLDQRRHLGRCGPARRAGVRRREMSIS